MRFMSNFQQALIRRMRAMAVGLRQSGGAQLLEVALTLPVLMALVVGASDFGGAYTMQHNLNNVAREGARFAASESSLDLNCGNCSTTPNSVKAVRNVVVNYLSQNHLTTCTVGSTPSFSSTNLTWTYTSTTTGCSSFSLKIVRNYPVNESGTYVVTTHVVLTYPYTWTYNKVAGFLEWKKNPNQTSLPSTIVSDAIMKNIA